MLPIGAFLRCRLVRVVVVRGPGPCRGSVVGRVVGLVDVLRDQAGRVGVEEDRAPVVGDVGTVGGDLDAFLDTLEAKVRNIKPAP